jgi:hypothetical protein
MTGGALVRWKWFFAVAALFNFSIGVPLMVARRWTFGIAFLDAERAGAGLAPDLWADFGFAVVLIGIGYAFIAADPPRQRAIVWLGVFAKAFDVITLSWRTAAGITHPIVLIPGAIDGLFLIGFVLYLARSRAAT